MQPGEWQFTTTMSSAMTSKPQTSTVTRCVKPGDTDPSRLGQDKPAQSDCKHKVDMQTKTVGKRLGDCKT